MNHKLDYTMVKDVFNHIISLPYLYYKNRTTGEITSRINDVSEIKEALKEYKSVMLVALDMCYTKIKNIIDETYIYKAIIISAKDSMKPLMKIGYQLLEGTKIEKPISNEKYIYWAEFYNYPKYSRKKLYWENCS